MIALYLDYVLSDEELVELQLAVGEPVSPLRIPWLLPMRSSSPPSVEPESVRPHLRRLRIEQYRGRRVLLITPRESHWVASLAEAIRLETGLYPLLVQPPVRRQEAGCPGPLRVIDMEAYLLDEDAAEPPPWTRDDGLLPPDL